MQTVLQPMPPRVLVPIRVGDGDAFDFVLDTGAPLTSMSQSLYPRLAATGHLTRVATNRFVLRRVRIEEYEIGDLNIRGSNFLSRANVDAVLGLDFLAKFTTINFHVPTGVLTLTP